MLEFEFNGYTSNEFGIIIASIENNDDLESRSLILGNKNKYRARENHFGTTYDQNYSFDVVLIKNPCKKSTLPSLEQTGEDMNVNDTLIYDVADQMSIENGLLKFPKNYEVNLTNGILTTDSEDYFTSNDIKVLNAWLTSPQFPKKLKFINNEYFKEDIEFFVTFTEVNTENVGKPFKLTYTAVCDSPYGYTPIQEEKLSSNTLSSTGNKMSDQSKIKYVYNMTDCRNEYVYPTLEIKPVVANAPITICNLNVDPDKALKIYPKNTDRFFMDCEHLKVYKKDSDGNEKLITFGDDLGVKEANDILKIYWPRLVYGCNAIWTDGLAFITIRWREPRKVGVFI